mgnify:CR=1 FL=1
MNNTGLYIHIPFCVRKCNYCDFYSINASEDQQIEYVNKVKESVDYWQKNALCNKHIDTVYFGGGTPSVLGTDLLSDLLDKITSTMNVTKDAEITMEMNPNSAATLDLPVLSKYGLNRISMGLQTSNDEELKLLGRSHTSKDAQKAIEAFHKANLTNFSLDVMLGIPLQNADSLNKTLRFCIDSDAQHISTYMLKIEENTRFFSNPDNLTFADEDMMVDLYNQTCDTLNQKGFRHYEISNFCKNDNISRHNMKYWILEDYLGIGPSAHSMLNNKRFYYPSQISSFAPENIQFESEGKTAEEYIMLTLRTDYGFSFKKYKELFNKKVSAAFMTKARYFEKLGYITINSDSIILNEKGFLLSNPIISELLNTEI